jgi:hypothetical protein
MKLHFLYALFLLTLFDALVGGALAARLQHLGWDQNINDLYQMSFAFSCALMIAGFFLVHRVQMRLKRSLISNGDELLKDWFWNTFKSLQDARWQALYLLAMLLAYSEDLLFYPALWAFDALGMTNLLSGGYDYNFQRFLWPWSLSGWFGFVTRWIFGETIKLPTIWAMILSVGTLAVILWHQNFLNSKRRTS